ncbi:MAG: copper amine oxidase N-terminal domain-containing protein [Defluviitaleaceae bacterium]|nr:copper amine oxidase N-terminal domain-containing protein [Defluviitaleaceae bacterium]
MIQKSKTKRFLALFAAVIMAALLSAVVVSAQATFDLGDFDQFSPDGWQNRWNTEETDEPAGGRIPMEVLASATHLVLEFSDFPSNDVELIIMGDGNGWSWRQEDIYSPEDGELSAMIDLAATVRDWEAIIGGDGAAIILGSHGLADYIESAYLILEGGAGPIATPAPTATPAPVPPVSTGASVLQLTLGSTNYTLNGVGGTLEVAPASIDGRTMVPLRFIGETLGATIDWNDATRTATFKLGTNVANVTIGQPLPNDMGTPIIENGRTLVPVRFVSTAMGAEVDWVPPSTVIVSFGGGEANVNVDPGHDHGHDDDCDDPDCDHDYDDDDNVEENNDDTPVVSGEVIFEVTASADLAAEIMDQEAEGLSLAGLDNGDASIRFEGGALVVYGRANTQWPGWQGIDIMLEDLDLSASGTYALIVEGAGTGAQLGLEWPLDGDPWDTGRVTGSNGSVTMTFSGNPQNTPGKSVSPGQSEWRIRVNVRGSDAINVGDFTVSAIRIEKIS